MSVYPKLHNWDPDNSSEISTIQVINRSVSPSTSLPTKVPWGNNRPKPVSPSDSIMHKHEELRSYAGKFSEKLDNKTNRQIAAEYGFVQRHSRRTIDQINNTLALASVLDPRVHGVGSKGGHIARRCGSPGPLNHPFEPQIGAFKATHDATYNVLYRNQKYQEHTKVHNPQWEHHFSVAGSLNLTPVYHFPSSVKKEPSFERAMNQYRYSANGREYQNKRIMSAAQIEEYYKHHDWRSQVSQGKASYKLTLNPNIKEGEFMGSLHGSRAESRVGSRTASPSLGRKSASPRLSGRHPECTPKKLPPVAAFSGDDWQHADDAMSAVTMELEGSIVGESVGECGFTAGDDNSVSGSLASKIASSVSADEPRTILAHIAVKGDQTESEDQPPVNYIPEGELTPLQYAVMEAEFGVMQDEIKLLGLNIDSQDIQILLETVELPSHRALPLASYIGALCGIPATFEAIVDVLRHKSHNILGFIHEVEPLCLSLRRIRKAFEIKARMMHSWKWKLPDECYSSSLTKIWSWVACFDNIAELIIAIYRVRREFNSTSSTIALTTQSAADSSPFFSDNQFDDMGVGFPTILLYRQFCKDLSSVKECPSFWERVHKKVEENQAEEEETVSRRSTMLVEKSFREMDMGVGITRRGTLGISGAESEKDKMVSKSSRSTIISPVSFNKFQGHKSRKGTGNSPPKSARSTPLGGRLLEDLPEDEFEMHQPSQEEIMSLQTENIGQRRKGNEVGSVIADNLVDLATVDVSMKQDNKVVLAARKNTLFNVMFQATTEVGPVPDPPQIFTLSLLGTKSREDATDSEIRSSPPGTVPRGSSRGGQTSRESDLSSRSGRITTNTPKGNISRNISREVSVPIN